MYNPHLLTSFDNRNHWKQFFESQSGAGFVGERFPRGGFSLGNMLSGLLKSALPVLKTVGKTVGKTALKTGLNMANDVVQGRNLQNSFEENMKQGASTLLTKANRRVKKKKKLYKKQKGGKRLGYFGGKRKTKRISKNYTDIFQ